MRKPFSSPAVLSRFFLLCVISYSGFFGDVSPALGGLPVIDAVGRKIEVPSSPRRIVTLAPSLGELAAEILGSDLDRIVGVSEFTDFPPALKKLPTVGAYSHFSVEKVAALKPDLVLATTDGNTKEQIRQLEELKIPVVIVKSDSFGGIGESMLLSSKVLGVPEVGEKMARRLNQGVENIKKKSASKPRLKVLLQIGLSPVVVVGGGTFLNDAIQAVGAENSFGDSTIHYPRPSSEEVLARNPDVILILEMGESPTSAERAVQDWMSFKTLNAAKNKAIRVLHSDALVRPSLRILEGLALLEKAVHEKK
ncbi:MAG: ABC transporter substrate-binding protein [Bdellovibrio sp.]|nr:ABC transporter substrate-binding protein [Bdellovibrio sp.]